MLEKMLLLALLLAVVARADYVAWTMWHGDTQCTGDVLQYMTIKSPVFFDYTNGSLETMPHAFGVCTYISSSTQSKVFSNTLCFDGATVLVSLFSNTECTLPLPNTIPTKYMSAFTSCSSFLNGVSARATCTKGAMPFPAMPESSVITVNAWAPSESCTGVPLIISVMPMTFGGVCVDKGQNDSGTALCSPDGHLLSFLTFPCHGCACKSSNQTPFPIGSGCKYMSESGTDVTVECHSHQLEPGQATDNTPSAGSQAALPLSLFGLFLCAALGYFFYKKRRATQPAQDNVHLASASEIASNVDDSAVLDLDAETSKLSRC